MGPFPDKIYFVISSCYDGKRVNIYASRPDSDSEGRVNDPFSSWLGYMDVTGESIQAEIGDVIEVPLPDGFCKKAKNETENESKN